MEKIHVEKSLYKSTVITIIDISTSKTWNLTHHLCIKKFQLYINQTHMKHISRYLPWSILKPFAAIGNCCPFCNHLSMDRSVFAPSLIFLSRTASTCSLSFLKNLRILTYVTGSIFLENQGKKSPMLALNWFQNLGPFQIPESPISNRF